LLFAALFDLHLHLTINALSCITLSE